MSEEPSHEAEIQDKKDRSGLFANVRQLLAFMKVMKVSRRSLFFSIILSFVATLFNIATLRLFMALLKGMISRDFEFVEKMRFFSGIVKQFPEELKTSNALFGVLITAIFLFTLAKSTLQYASALSVGVQVKKATRSLRETIFDRYLTFGKLYYDRVNLGRLNTVLTKFAHAISSQLNSLQRLASQVFSLAAYFGIMLFISWPLTLLTFSIFPLFVFLSRKAAAQFKGVSKRHAESETHLDERILSVLSMIPLVKAHGTEETEKRIFREVSEAEAAASFQLDKREKLIHPIQEVNMMIAFLILASVVTVLIPAEKGHIASYLVFFYLVRLSLPGFTAISQLRIALNHSSARIEKIGEILSDEKKFIVTGGDAEFEGLKRSIEFKHLDFCYDEKRQVLYDISLVLEKGKMTAVVGPTGAGKTTLAHLLLRFYDCEPGKILLDGKDIRNFSLKSLTRHFSYVSQDAFFFNDTVKMNMTYGLAGPVPEEKLIDAAKKARIYGLIMALPDQFETKIGDRGVQLSGGEKQRFPSPAPCFGTRTS